MKKKKEILTFEFNTRFELDQLQFGWMCPLCQKIYAPSITVCPENHMLCDGKWEKVEAP